MLVRPRGDVFSRLAELKGDGEAEYHFAIRAGVTPNTYRLWKIGRVPSDRVIDDISTTLQVSPFWLKYGIGPRDMESAERWLEEQAGGEE